MARPLPGLFPSMTDFKFAVRQLLKHPGFTLVAVLTLALGIGANTAIFTVVDGVLLKPLPYPEPERLVTVWESSPGRGIEQERVSGPNYLDWRERNTVFRDLAVSPGWEGSSDFNLVLPDGTTKVHASYTSASLFTTLGVAPMLGRTFRPEEDRKEGNRVAVLSHGLWQRRFGGDTNILGRTLALDTYGRRDYAIVGVMPPGFGLPSRCELWLPLGWMGVTLDERRSAHWHLVLGRLKPGVTLGQARAQMNGIQAGIAREHPEALVGSAVTIVPLLDEALGRDLKVGLWLLSAAVVGVLLIGCANVANLLLARAAGRQKEMALRVALGASRWRIIRSLMVENLLLAVVGGGLGLLLASWILRFLVANGPADVPRLGGVTLDGTALVFCLSLAVLTALLFGLAPAWQASQSDGQATLKEAGRAASAGRAAGRMRDLLVIAEVALSLVLLVGAALMVQSFVRLAQADRGFRTEHVVTADLDFSVSGFTTWTEPTSTRPQVSLAELLERLRRHPGVAAVGAASGLPREVGSPSQPIVVAGRAATVAGGLPTADYAGVTPEYLKALGVPLRRGRGFNEGDGLQAPRVVIVNETFARRYFANDDPIGQRVAMGGRKNPAQPDVVPWERFGPWAEIVGVVADMRGLGPAPRAGPQVFVPYEQWPMQSPTLVVRTIGDPTALAAFVSSEIRSAIPRIPAASVRTMDDLLADSVAQPRFQSWLLGGFGLLALGLAAVGLYGVLACIVAQRTHEIGIRIALGAARKDVLALVVGQGMRLALAGVGVGVAGGVALTRVLANLLYEVKPADPTTFVVVSIFLASVALLACWVPARRAVRIDPMEALRRD